MNPTIFQSIQHLIADGKTEKALDKLSKAISENAPEWRDNIVLLKSSLSKLNREITTGLIDSDKAEIRRNRINSGALKLMTYLEGGEQNPSRVLNELKSSFLGDGGGTHITNTTEIQDSNINIENSKDVIIGSGNTVTKKIFNALGKKQFWIILLGLIALGSLTYFGGAALMGQQKENFFSLQDIEKEISTLSDLNQKMREKLEKNAPEIESWLSKGTKAMKSGDYGTAIQYFERVSKEAPLATVHQNLAAAYDALGNSDKANKNREKAEEINPNLNLKKSYADLKGKRINLLSPKNGGEPLILSNPGWKIITNDNDKDIRLFVGSGKATYGFLDERTATFDMFKLLIIREDGFNIKKIKLSYSNDSPESKDFTLIGTFDTYNGLLTRTPFQEFTFDPVKAKYFRFEPLEIHRGGKIGNIRLGEIQLMGALD